MSRGGFGRGGGRGGGAAGRNSGAQQLLSFDLLRDVGVNGLFNVQTALFPEMEVPIKSSPFYLTEPPPPRDIERYSDRYKQPDKNKRKLRDIQTDLDMFPEELHSILDSTKAKKKRKQVMQDDFGKIEALLDNANEDKEEDEEGGENQGSDAEEEEEDYDEEELVDDNDYGQNYFDNGEDDGDDGDDGDGEGYY
ncbi:unnamed protein product [Cunninghamella echinulata]